MLLKVVPLIYRKRRRPGPTRRSSAPVATGPVLLSATFGDGGEPVLALTFDRAVDVSGLAPGDLFVYQGPGGIEWGGTAVFEQPTQASVSVTMIENAEFVGSGVTLTASGGAGIVAADDDVAWAGVSGLELPFP